MLIIKIYIHELNIFLNKNIFLLKLNKLFIYKFISNKYKIKIYYL